MSEQATLGEIDISGRKDILSMALEKDEHPGRTRGVGQYVTITEHFGHASRSTSSGKEGSSSAIREIEDKMEEKLKALREENTQSQAASQAQIQGMQEFIEKLLRQMNKEMTNVPIPEFIRPMPNVETTNDPSPSILQSTSAESSSKVL